MVLSIATVVCVSIAIVAIVDFIIHKTRKGRLIDQIPGPTLWPVLGNAIEVSCPHEELWGLLRKYGNDYYSIYKLWICHWAIIGVRHPDDVEAVFSSQKNITKSLFYDFLRPWMGDGLLMSTGSKWRQRRKILTPAFHFNLLQDFVGALVDTAERMAKSLRDEGGEPVKDVIPFLAKFSLNAICETAMGTVLQDDDPEQDEYREAVKQMGEFAYHRAARPWLKNDWIFSLTEKGRQQAAAVKVLHGFTTGIINKRKQFHKETGGRYLQVFSQDNEKSDPTSSVPIYEKPLQKKRLAMLDLLIAVQQETGVIDDPGICEEVDTFVFEGHDTTNATMSFAVLLLAESTEIQARARAEIGAVLKESNGKLGMAELQKLTYLDRCIKEALRLFPAVPNVTRGLTEDLQLRNYLIPTGAVVAVHIYDVHRDPNFWPQPEVFDPDRFLPERIESRHPYSYVPFSAGPRNCIGQKFATLELKAFIGLLLHNFNLESLSSISAVHMLPDLVLKPMHPLSVKFVPIKR